MRRLFNRWCAIVVLLWILPVAYSADPRTEESPPATVDAAQVARLIERLDDADFETREDATRKLVALGEAVVEAVARSAEDENLERSMRSISILKALFESKDEDAKAAAGIALKRLCDSKKPSVARRANAIINPVDPTQNLRPGLRVNVRGLNLNVAGARRLQVQVANQNGRVEINIDEDDRKVRITHDDGKDIVVRVTEPPTKNQKEGKTTEYKAKDADELKKNHPEAAALFEKYATAGGINAINGQIAIDRLPFAPPLPELVPGIATEAARRKAAAELAAATAELTRLAGKLKEMAARADTKPEELKRLAEEIEAAAQRVTDSAARPR